MMITPYFSRFSHAKLLYHVSQLVLRSFETSILSRIVVSKTGLRLVEFFSCAHIVALFFLYIYKLSCDLEFLICIHNFYFSTHVKCIRSSFHNECAIQAYKLLLLLLSLLLSLSPSLSLSLSLSLLLLL